MGVAARSPRRQRDARDRGAGPVEQLDRSVQRHRDDRVDLVLVQPVRAERQVRWTAKTSCTSLSLSEALGRSGGRAGRRPRASARGRSPPPPRESPRPASRRREDGRRPRRRARPATSPSTASGAGRARTARRRRRHRRSRSAGAVPVAVAMDVSPALRDAHRTAVRVEDVEELVLRIRRRGQTGPGEARGVLSLTGPGLTTTTDPQDEPSTSWTMQSDGRREARGNVHRDGDWHGALHIWVGGVGADSTPSVLFQRRSQSKDSWPGALDCWRGIFRARGSAEVIREAEEEIGLVLTLGDVVRLRPPLRPQCLGQGQRGARGLRRGAIGPAARRVPAARGRGRRGRLAAAGHCDRAVRRTVPRRRGRASRCSAVTLPRRQSRSRSQGSPPTRRGAIPPSRCAR